MFDNISHTLASAVADNGTFAVSYPAGRGAGSYDHAHAHKMLALGAVRTSPVDFSISFGATTFTVTYLGSTTLPAGTLVRLQLDRQGDDDGTPENDTLADGVVKAPLHLINLGSPDLADADGLSASQTVTGAGTAFLLNGAVGATFDVPRNVVGAWTNTAIITITGLDVDGNVVVETSASGTSHTGKKAFKSITSVTTNATVTSATLGTGVVLGLPVFVPNSAYVVSELESGTEIVEAVVTLTDSTGDSGTHDNTLADGSSVGAAITDNTTGSAATTWAAGVGVTTLTFPHTMDATANAIDAITAYTPGYKFKILDWSFVTDVPGVGAGAARTYNMEIGTTDVGTSPSTCVLTEASTSAKGELTAGAAVSGANTGSASDTFSIEAAACGTAFSAGSGYFLVKIQNMDEADAMAGIAAQHNLLRTDSIVQNQNDSDLAQKVIEIVSAMNKVTGVDGTFVGGVTTAATGTSGDTRGTYSPATAPDGTIGYAMAAILPDPSDDGVAQYAG